MGFLFCQLSYSAEVPEYFFKALWQVETSGREGFIWGKSGELGPLQITKSYYIDAKRKDKSIVGSYTNCANYVFSKKVATAYFNRYEPKAVINKDWETLARLHNSGPNWKKKMYKTNGYWCRVKNILKTLDNQ